MTAPEHDPELFDELMREERRRARPTAGRRLAAGLVALAVLILVGVLVHRATTKTAEQLPEGTAHGLDVTAGQCFWSPTGTGEVDVLLRSCADPHTAEAFAVLSLTEESGVDQPYQRTLDRCTAAAHPIPGARVQVMTPNSGTGGKQRAVCYYRFATEMTAPAR
ncbi:hypothetical protein AB0M83_26315 [Amycolatopsis sp. NPDC051106]|uniref:hypothetical protein n=1 Tax=unclassified Amycolatopsis TaxID=2618356 RepID=UPI0034303F0D